MNNRFSSAWRALLARVLLGAVALVSAAGAQTPSAAPVATHPAAKADIEVFVREGCPHCAEAERFLAVLAREQPRLAITIRDVTKEPAALERLQELARENRQIARVPAFWLNGQLLLGYSTEAGSDRLIRSVLAGAQVRATDGQPAGTCEAADAKDESKACARPTTADAEAASPVDDGFAITFFGRTLKLDDIGLPLFTLAMGLLDGFNPCSMWVLLLMISLLAPLNDRKRMIAIAGTFVVVEGIAYFVFMAAWLNLFMLIGVSRTSQIIIALIAIAAGLINLKDFFAFKWGFSLSIPDGSKPGIYQRMRTILQAPTYTAAIIGTIILALLVQVVEFMCTSGFPALYTRILTLRELDTGTYYSYLLLYNAAYMLDDIIVLTIGVVMLSRHRLQEKEGRVLKLISGAVMVGLGLYLLIDL
jgi:glutaredoxin